MAQLRADGFADRTAILGGRRQAPVGQQVEAEDIVPKRIDVHSSRHGHQTNAGLGSDLLIGQRPGQRRCRRRHRQGHQDPVPATGGRHPLQRGQRILPDRAAEAGMGQRDQFVFGHGALVADHSVQ